MTIQDSREILNIILDNINDYEDCVKFNIIKNEMTSIKYDITKLSNLVYYQLLDLINLILKICNENDLYKLETYKKWLIHTREKASRKKSI